MILYSGFYSEFYSEFSEFYFSVRNCEIKKCAFSSLRFHFCSGIFFLIVEGLMMSGNKRACVVVLGDVGRSPRMQYHAMSLRKEGYKVDIVGYAGSAPRSELVFDSNVAIHYMKQPPQFQSGTLLVRSDNYTGLISISMISFFIFQPFPDCWPMC